MNRAQRRHHNNRVITNRLKELKQLSNSRYNCLLSKKNVLNKQDAYDCGNPKCTLCNYDKLYGNKDNKGRRLNQQELIEIIDDYFNDVSPDNIIELIQHDI